MFILEYVKRKTICGVVFAHTTLIEPFGRNHACGQERNLGHCVLFRAGDSNTELSRSGIFRAYNVYKGREYA